MSCRTRIVYHQLYGRRGFTAMRRTWNRYERFLATLPASPLKRLVPLMEAPAATEDDLLRVHAPAYVEMIKRMDATGQGRLDGSTPAWQGMYARAERVVGGSLLAADLIHSGHALHVFNPAGGQHHAHRGRGGGFCVFHDVVAAVRRFQALGYRRIAVVDVDGHHGDGTESLLLYEPILTVSTHQFGDRTYPGTGPSDTVGQGPGRGHTLNLPLARGTGGETFLAILRGTVEPVLRAYRPDILIAEFGTDGHVADPFLRLRLSTADYALVAHWIHALAHDLCGGRLLIVGGGGYNPEQVVRCWLLMLADLAGLDVCDAHPDAAGWCSEAPPMPDVDADMRSLVHAERSRNAIFPFYGLA